MKQKNEVFTPPYTILNTHVRTSGQVIDYWHNLLKVSEAHSDTKGAGAVVYILDTAKEWLASDLPKEGNEYAFDGTGQPDDSGNHGHLCAGITGAVNNDYGVLGVAPESLMIPVKGLHISSGSWDWIIKGLDYIIDNYKKNFKGNKVGIINMSFGGSVGSSTLYNKLKEAVEVGLIPVAAAGNTGGAVTFPGGWDDVCITVPALDSNLNPASFSASGPATDVSAFGVSVISTAPNDTYPIVSGTSFSSPMIAGVCALIADKHLSTFVEGNATNKEVMEQHLKKFALDLLEPGEDDETGAGLAVIPPYLANPPIEQPDDPGNPPDDPEDPPKEERILTIPIEENLFIEWQATLDPAESFVYPTMVKAVAPQGANRLFIDKLILDVTTTASAEGTYKEYKEAVKAFFKNRGLILLKGSDMFDAAKWTVHFMEMILEREGLVFDTKELHVSDREKNKLIWS